MKYKYEKVDETVVALDIYNSDLNLVIDASKYSAHPLTNEGFAFMWAGVRATHGAAKGKFCFEVKVLEHLDVSHLPVDEPNPNVVRVGVSVESTTLQLGEDPLSYGYGGTGKISTNCQFKDYGGTFAAGDCMLCAVNFDSDQVQIGFAKNGKFLGWAFRVNKNELQGKALYPHVLTKNCSFEVNFGQRDQPYFPPPEALKDYTFVGCLPADERVGGTRPPENREDCEMIMMCGLPGAGKSVWAAEYSAKHPEKKFNVLGTNNIIDKMKVMGLPRKRNYAGRWDVLIQMATKCLNKMFEIGSKLKRNYILDQTNVYPTAQRRKMRNFEGFKRVAVVVVPTEDEYRRRCDKRDREEGKEVPDQAVLEMKANFKLPEVSDIFDEVIFTELQKDEAEELVQKYNEEGRMHVGPPSKKMYKPNDAGGNKGYDNSRGNYPNRGGPPHGGFDNNRGRRGNFFGNRGGFDGGRDFNNQSGFEGGRGGYMGGRGGFEARNDFDGRRGGFDRGRGGFNGGRGRGFDGGRRGFDEGRSRFDEGRGSFEGARGGFDGGRRGGFDSGRGGFDSGRGGFDSGRGGFDSGRGGFDSGRGGFDSGRGGFDSGRGGFDSGRGGFEGGRGSFEGGRGSFEGGRGGFEGGRRGNFEGGRGGFGRGRGGFGGGRGSYDSNRGGNSGGWGSGFDGGRGGSYDSERGSFDNGRGNGNRGGFDSKARPETGMGNSSYDYDSSSYSDNSSGFPPRSDMSHGVSASSIGRGSSQARGSSGQGNYGARDYNSGNNPSRQFSDSGKDFSSGQFNSRNQGGSARGGGSYSVRGNSGSNFNSSDSYSSEGFRRNTSSSYDSGYGSYGNYGDKSRSYMGGRDNFSSKDTSRSYSGGSPGGYKKESSQDASVGGSLDTSSRSTRATVRPSGRTGTRWSAETTPTYPQTTAVTTSQTYTSYVAPVKTGSSVASGRSQYDTFPTYSQNNPSQGFPAATTYGYQQPSAMTSTIAAAHWTGTHAPPPPPPVNPVGQADQSQWSQYYQQTQPNQYFSQYYGQPASGTPAYGTK